jgi:hypothetical protein
VAASLVTEVVGDGTARFSCRFSVDRVSILSRHCPASLGVLTYRHTGIPTYHSSGIPVCRYVYSRRGENVLAEYRYVGMPGMRYASTFRARRDGVGWAVDTSVRQYAGMPTFRRRGGAVLARPIRRYASGMSSTPSEAGAVLAGIDTSVCRYADMSAHSERGGQCWLSIVRRYANAVRRALYEGWGQCWNQYVDTCTSICQSDMSICVRTYHVPTSLPHSLNGPLSFLYATVLARRPSQCLQSMLPFAHTRTSMCSKCPAFPRDRQHRRHTLVLHQTACSAPGVATVAHDGVVGSCRA